MTLAAGAGRSAGPLGLLVIVVLCVVTVLLIRNMSKRLRRLPPEFPDPAMPPDPFTPPDGPDAGA